MRSGVALLALGPVVVAVRKSYRVVGDGPHILHNPLLGTDSVPVLQLMLGEIDFGNYASLLYLADSLFKVGFRSGHDPGIGALERLPRLFLWNEVKGEGRKCARCFE